MVIFMKITGSGSLSHAVKIILILILIGGAALWIGLPWALKWYQWLDPATFADPNYHWFLLVFLYITGAIMLCIVYQIIRIFSTLSEGDPFVKSNVHSLAWISVGCALLSVCYLVKVILYISPLTIVCTMIFIIASVGALVLKDVFRTAIQYKEDNELTI